MKEIILIDTKNEQQRGVLAEDVYNHGTRVATIPDNLNNDNYLDIVRMYLLNKEFRWDVFMIRKVK